MSGCELKNRIVTLRKTRKCVGCLVVFVAGDRLRYRVQIYERDFQTDYICEDCNNFLIRMPSDELEEGFFPGDLGEWRMSASGS